MQELEYINSSIDLRKIEYIFEKMNIFLDEILQFGKGRVIIYFI